MPNIIKNYIKFIDFISLKTGRATMYLVFVMMFILILSFVTRNIINIPLIWIIEMAQFVMTGYLKVFEDELTNNKTVRCSAFLEVSYVCFKSIYLGLSLGFQSIAI